MAKANIKWLPPHGTQLFMERRIAKRSDRRLSKTWRARVGAALKEARDAAGLTQAKLAERAGIDWTTVSQIENAASAPDLATMDTIADILHVSLDVATGRRVDPDPAFALQFDGLGVSLSLRVIEWPEEMSAPEALIAGSATLEEAFRGAGIDIVRSASDTKAKVILARITPPAASSETESLGPSLGTLQSSVEKTLEKLGQLEDRIAKLENAPAKATATPRKGASQ